MRIFRDAVLSILATIAQQERVRLSERVTAGLARAKKQGRVGGRPRLVVDRERVAALRAAGQTRSQIAAALGMSTRSVSRLWKLRMSKPCSICVHPGSETSRPT